MRIRSVVATVGVALALCVGVAPAHANTNVDECLDGGYLPYDVASWQRDGRAVRLSCGSPLGIGILHINEEHTVTPATGDAFIACIGLVAQRGTDLGPAAASTPSTLYEYNYNYNDSVRLVVQNADGLIVSTFTLAGTKSNDWTGCAA